MAVRIGAASGMESVMTFIDLAKKTGGLGATTAIVATLALSGPNPAQARVSTGAAVGIGLGAFALGSALGAGAYYSPYYAPYYGYGYGYAPAYSYYPPATYYYPPSPYY